MVKNESDIIEAFIRYHTAILDGMVILDNGSTDNTVEIISKLIEEKLPVYLIFDDNPSFEQSKITTDLLYSTIRNFNPEFVIPLDADEFLMTESKDNVRKELENSLFNNALHYLGWITYVPTQSDDSLELNVLKRIRKRRLKQYNHSQKIIIHTSIAKQKDLLIEQGNHDIIIDSCDITKIQLSNLHLAHYPIRSIQQFKSKHLVGWLANIARKEHVLFDWYDYYNCIKTNDNVSMDELTQMALYYGVLDKSQNIQIIESPIELAHIKPIELKYTNLDNNNFLKNVLNYTENLARKYSDLSFDKRPYTNNCKYNDQIILQIIRQYTTIDGWLNASEAIELFKLANSLLNHKNLTICEIGCWQGKSSYVLAKAIESKPDASLYCIDPFNYTGDLASESIYLKVKSTMEISLLDRFTENMNRLGVMKKIKIIQGYSSDVINIFTEKIDLLFIDGNHDYDSVLRDYQQWSPLVKVGGYIAFHDVGAVHTKGPKQVVEKYVVKNDMWGSRSDQKLVNELYIARRVK